MNQDLYRKYLNIGLFIEGHKIFFGKRKTGDYFFGIKRIDQKMGHIYSSSGKNRFKTLKRFLSVVFLNRKVYAMNYRRNRPEESTTTDGYVY